MRQWAGNGAAEPWRSRDRKHALVAGGAGFIGRHLVRRLLGEGYRVTVLDNLSSGRRAALPAHPDLRFRFHDVTQPLPDVERTSLVVNLASPAVPEQYESNPIVTLLTGALGTQALLELAHRDGATFLLGSTSEIYGDVGVADPGLDESDSTRTPPPRSVRACYAVAKRYAEQLTVAAAARYGINAAIIRLFNVYGPGMDDGETRGSRVIPAMVRAARSGRPLPIRGDGSQTRSYTWIDDVVEALVRLGETPDLDGEVLNVGSQEEITVAQLAAMVHETIGATGIRRLARDPHEPHRRKPSIERIGQKIGWRPRTSLREGLLGYVDTTADEALADEGVSIIVPSHGRPDGIERLIAALERLTPAPRACIIVDDATPGGPPAALGNWADRARQYSVKLVALSTKRGPAAARNAGLAVAHTRYVAFTDNDCEPLPRWVEALERRLDREPARVAGVGGRVVARRRDLFSRYYEQQRILEPPEDRSYLVTANAAFRTDLVRGVGGFDERIQQPGGEDPGLCFALGREGFRFEVEPDATVVHDFRRGLRDFARTFYRYGKGCAHVVRELHH